MGLALGPLPGWTAGPANCVLISSNKHARRIGTLWSLQQTCLAGPEFYTLWLPREKTP